MSQYTIVTNFLSKDSLASGNPAKLVKGADLTTEFTAVQTALNSKFDGAVNFSPDGSAAQPSFGFASIAGTGMFNASGVLQFATSGSSRFSVSAAGGIFAANATGGDQGLGTGNFTNLYINGVAVAGGGAAAAGTLTGTTLAANVLASSLTSLGTLASLAVTGAITTGGNQLFFGVPQSTNTTAAVADVGKCINATGTITVPNSVFSAGHAFSIYNNSASSITISAGVTTMRLAGTATTGSRTLAQRGLCTVWFESGTECIVSGAGVS